MGPIDSIGPIDLLVAGGGAAGLAAAWAAAEGGLRVAVADRLPRFGTRLRATGGGRCNVGNTAPLPDFARAFGAAERFVKPALAAFWRDRGGVEGWLSPLGIQCRADDGFHLFPVHIGADELCERLIRRLRQFRVTLLPDRPVASVVQNERGFGVVFDTGFPASGSAHALEARSVLIACGGRARPDLGGSDAAARLARPLGHAVTWMGPALCGLRVAEEWCLSLTGISLPLVRAWLEKPPDSEAPSASQDVSRPQTKPPPPAPLSFTHTGLSGPAALNLAGEANRRMALGEAVDLRANFTPSLGPNEWRARLREERRRDGARTALSIARQSLPLALARALIEQAGCADVPLARMTRREVESLSDVITRCRFRIAGTGRWDQAMAAKGGIDLGGVDPKTMRSRLVPGLYFAGEALDVDGPCGGYNLTWAFASGALAGSHCAAMPNRAGVF